MKAKSALPILSAAIALYLTALIGFTAMTFAQGQPTATTAASTPAAKKTIQGAQERLLALGYQPGVADGVMGAKAIAALKKFQADHSLPVTGLLDTNTLEALNAKSLSAKIPSVRRGSVSHREIETAVDSEERDWAEAVLKNNSSSFLEFQHKHPDSPNVRIVQVTLGGGLTLLGWDSWSPRDLDGVRRTSSETNGSWGYAVNSAEILIYPLTIQRASALGIRTTKDLDGVMYADTTSGSARVLCVKDGAKYWIIDVEP